MLINGIMIDCSRTIEKHEYYFQLLEFMSEWGMNALLLHFSDDPGLAIELPGFENLALRNAFSVAEIKKLITFGQEKGIDIIPELETFGHTKYITAKPEYAHLYAGPADRDDWFNAIDPLSSETHELVGKLMKNVAEIFPSEYMHVGCDEVNLKSYSEERGLDKDEVWTNYVNKIIGKAEGLNKKAMIWADHVANTYAWMGRECNDELISGTLSKNVILVDWRYEEDIEDTVIEKLKGKSFNHIISSPSLACYRYRFFPTSIAFENTRKMALFSARNKIMGVINTIWHPARYLRDSLYYGIAYSAEVVAGGGNVKFLDFQKKFSLKTFGVPLSDALKVFLDSWLETNISEDLLQEFGNDAPSFSGEHLERLKEINASGRKALAASESFKPGKNHEIWNAFIVSAKAAWIFSEYFIVSQTNDQNRLEILKRDLKLFKKEIEREWDRTRFEDSNEKSSCNSNDENLYVLQIMNKLISMASRV